MPVVQLHAPAPDEPHPVVEDLVTEAQAEPLLWARGVAFTYYRGTRALLIETDRVLDGTEQAALDALLEAHQGEPDV